VDDNPDIRIRISTESARLALRDSSPTNAPESSKKPKELRPADLEMARVLNTPPLQIAGGIDPSQALIARWHHGALHDVVEPMSDHVVMTYIGTMQRLARRSGRSFASGTARPGVVTIIPAGSSARWDIDGNVDVLQLYLSRQTMERVAAEAGDVTPNDLLERTGHPDPTISRLLTMATDALDGGASLDTLFRQQLTELIATRLLASHTGTQTNYQPPSGGLSPTVLRRAIERLGSESDTDVSLATLASDAGLSRFHFCRAFKESTGLSPHTWLRQHRLEQAKALLRDPSVPIVVIATELGYGSQTAFAAAFRRLTGETPTDWRRQAR
jgi:AraC family transcriptional regulator